MKLFLTGERFNGKQAVDFGLAHRAVPKTQLFEAVREEIEAIKLGGLTLLLNARSLCAGFLSSRSKRDLRKLQNGVSACLNLRKVAKA